MIATSTTISTDTIIVPAAPTASTEEFPMWPDALRCRDCQTTAHVHYADERCTRCRRKLWDHAKGSRGRRAQRAARRPARYTSRSR